MVTLVKKAILGQYEAALAMMGECVRKCPEEEWDGKIAKYPFWQAVYHTLCFVDLYLTPDEGDWKPRKVHPKGMEELSEEYPSRRFGREELLEYLEVCGRKAAEVVGAETRETLEGPTGHARLKFSRLELHLYNLRHVAHHTGQLSAFLRRAGVKTGWVKTGEQ